MTGDNLLRSLWRLRADLLEFAMDLEVRAMRRLLVLACAIVVSAVVGCDRGFPDESPPTGKNEMNSATSNSGFFGSVRPNVSFSKDALVPSQDVEEEDTF